MEAITENKIGFKKTKVGWIPDDWSFEKLGNVAVIQMGQSPDSSSYNSKGNGEFLIQGNADINNRRTTPRVWTSEPTKLCEVGSILMTVRAPVGAVAKSNHKACIGRGMCSVVSTKLSTEFLYQFLVSYENLWKRLEQGSTFTAVNGADIRGVLIPFPILKEQTKIAQILSTWDQAISDAQNLIGQLQNRKKGLMQQLLIGKKRLKGFQSEWKERKLGEYFEERKEVGYNDLVLLSIGRNGVYPQDSDKKDNSNSDKSKYKRILPMDIGYNTMRMWQGRSALSEIEGIVSPAYTIVKPKENNNPVFFSYLFKLDEMVHKFYRNSQGMVSDTWMCKFKDFSKVKFMAPPSIEEQNAIAEILKNADIEISAMEEKLIVLEEQKKGLMQQLLTGKKRVKL